MRFTQKFTRMGLAVAIAGLALTLGGCSKKADEQLGPQSKMISSSDSETGKQIVASSAPAAGQSNIAVDETVQYVHTKVFGANQVYSVKTGYTAEYVERLNAWMVYDGDGTLYRFTAGNTNGAQTQKPTIDIGTRTSALAADDASSVQSVAAAGISGDGQSRTLVVVRRRSHGEKYDTLTYSVSSETSAPRVELQNAWMAWIDGTEYRVDQSGSVQALSSKPTANIGSRAQQISSNDQPVGQRAVAAGPVSAIGTTRLLIVTQDYNHEETYQYLRYSLQDAVTAQWVDDQHAFMAYVGQDLYKATLQGDVIQLASKPVVDLGTTNYKLSSSDVGTSVDVIPTALTANNQAIIVTIRRNYSHESKYEVKRYHTDDRDVALYSQTYKDWYVRVDGHIYVITFPGDNAVNDPSVVVVQAPSGFQHPVLVVPGQNGAPPVAVPSAPSNTNGAPPVAVPSNRVNGAPPVAVPSGKGSGVPPVVVPH